LSEDTRLGHKALMFTEQETFKTDEATMNKWNCIKLKTISSIKETVT
jgi:hypothetical protein